MTDDQPSGSCPTCAHREPRTPQLCDVCRSRLRSNLFDIPSLYAELQERTDEMAEPLDVRPYVATVPEWTGREVVHTAVVTNRPADPVSYHLTSGASSSPSRGGPVSGSKERRLPIDEDAVDLTGPVRSAGVAVLDEDAVGYASVASVLDFWVEDWRTSRGKGERRPGATVSELAEWLLIRLDDACDHSPPIAEFFEAIRRLRGALQAQLGQVDIPEYKRGVPCPHCAALTLVFHAGSSYIECGSCPAQVSFLEYEEHVRALSAEQVLVRRVKVAQVKALRQMLGAMRGAGWRFVSSLEQDGWRLCHWFRDDAVVQCWIHPRTGQGPAAVWYHPVAGEGYALSVTTEWIAQEGFPALRKLARSVGILTAPKKEEVAA